MKRRDKKRVAIVIGSILIVIIAMIVGLRFIPGFKFTGLNPVQQTGQTVGGADGFASNDSGKSYEYKDTVSGESESASEVTTTGESGGDAGTVLIPEDPNKSAEERSFAKKTLLYGDHYFEITKDNKSIELQNQDDNYSCVFVILSKDGEEVWKSEKVASGGNAVWEAYNTLPEGYNSFQLKYEYYNGDKVVGSKSTTLRMEVIK